MLIEALHALAKMGHEAGLFSVRELSTLVRAQKSAPSTTRGQAAIPAVAVFSALLLTPSGPSMNPRAWTWRSSATVSSLLCTAAARLAITVASAGMPTTWSSENSVPSATSASKAVLNWLTLNEGPLASKGYWSPATKLPGPELKATVIPVLGMV